MSSAVNLHLIIKAFLKSSSRRDSALGRATSTRSSTCATFYRPPFPHLLPFGLHALGFAPTCRWFTLPFCSACFPFFSQRVTATSLSTSDVWSPVLPFCDYCWTECAVPGPLTGRPSVTKNHACSAVSKYLVRWDTVPQELLNCHCWSRGNRFDRWCHGTSVPLRLLAFYRWTNGPWRYEIGVGGHI